MQSFFDSRERISHKVGLSAEQTPESETFPAADETKSCSPAAVLHETTCAA